MLHADRFDSLIKYWSMALGMPWQLIKAVCRQESGINPLAVSSAGACGLMQLMPATAAELGVSKIFDPDSNLRGGITYLRQQYRRFPEIPGEDERWRFALASYNAGRGHINAAIRDEREDHPGSSDWQKWIHVVDDLPEITGDHAIETARYVANIMRYWDEYKTATTNT